MEREEREATFAAGAQLFEAGQYLAAHELFEELWEASEGGDADFYKALVQVAVALHHFEHGNLEGAAKLYGGHRRLLAPFLPRHAGIDLVRFLEEVQSWLAPALGRPAPEPRTRPRLLSSG